MPNVDRQPPQTTIDYLLSQGRIERVEPNASGAVELLANDNIAATGVAGHRPAQRRGLVERHD